MQSERDLVLADGDLGSDRHRGAAYVLDVFLVVEEPEDPRLRLDHVAAVV